MAKKNNFVESLIEHLRESGTGEAKLHAVATIAARCGSRDEFIAEIKSEVPPGTMAKITAYADANQPAKEEPAMTPEVPPQPIVAEEPAKAEKSAKAK